MGLKFQRYTPYKAVTAVVTATATWYSYTATEQHNNTGMLSNTYALITLPGKH